MTELFDNYSAYGTTGASTSDITMESVLASMEAMRAIPRPRFDTIVMTAARFDELRKRTQVDGFTDHLAVQAPYNSMMGLPIESYPTKADAIERCFKLTERGKRPMLVV
jgi:hypothetical protein